MMPRQRWQNGERLLGSKQRKGGDSMDWGAWSPSHTILVLFIVAGFAGQVAIYFYRTSQNDKKIDKQGETFVHALERFEERMDKRFVETNQRIGETNQRIDETNTGVNQRIDSLRSEMNQRFSEMNAEIADVRSEMRQLNQNHIEHLNRHHSP